MPRRGASGVSRSSSELAGGNLMEVTGSDVVWICGTGISGTVGKVICRGSGIPSSTGPPRPKESEAALVKAGLGEITGLGIGVGRPAGMGASGAGSSTAAPAGGTGAGVGLAAVICSAVGKLSFIIAVTSVGLADGEAAGAGDWAKRCAAGTTKRKKTAAKRELGSDFITLL